MTQQDGWNILPTLEGHAIIHISETDVGLDIKVDRTTPGELELIAQHILIAAGKPEADVIAAIENLPDPWDSLT